MIRKLVISCSSSTEFENGLFVKKVPKVSLRAESAFDFIRVELNLGDSRGEADLGLA